MLQLKVKHPSRRTPKIAAWSQPQQGWQWKQQSKLSLTQNLYKSNAEQLHQELRILLVICVLTGCAPLGVFPRYNSIFHDAVQHVWLLLIYIWLCFAAYLELIYSKQQLNVLESNFYLIESVIYLIHTPCIMILSMAWRKRIRGVFEEIGRFDLASGYVMQGHKLRSFVRWQLLLVLLFVYCSMSISFLSNNQNILATSYNWSTYVAPNVLTSISFLLYYTLMEGIYRRLRHVAIALNLELQRGDFIRRSVLQELRWQHRNLLHFTKKVNQTYGASMLMLFTSSLISFNTNLFLLYKAVESSKLERWTWWTYNYLWLIMHAIKMFCIIYFNHKVQQEQSHCLTLLSTVTASGEDLQETINHFALQLRDDVRSHVAYGLFELNYQLVPSLLMITTSLFIFLLQYDVTFQALASGNSMDTASIK